jgi:RNA:NAD 2'-phosphotransferase (TPT1/KptA family)
VRDVEIVGSAMTAHVFASVLMLATCEFFSLKKKQHIVTWLLRHSLSVSYAVTAVGPNGESLVPVKFVNAFTDAASRETGSSIVDRIKEGRTNPSNKDRFYLSDDEAYICAFSSHTNGLAGKGEILTAEAAAGMKPVHATKHTFVQSIMEKGLEPRGRSVHFALRQEDERKPRNGYDTRIKLNIVGAIASGIVFWIAANNVILCDGVVPPKFLQIM